MKASGKIGVGTIVLRQREQLAALEAMVLTTMRFAHEIRSPKQLELPGAGQGYSEKEMKLAQQLMDALSDEWDPRAFQDTYTEVLRRVTDLMDALQRSLSERPLAKAEGRKGGAARRSAAP